MSSEKKLFSQEMVERFVESIYLVSGMHVGLHDISRDRCQAAAGDTDPNLCAFCQGRSAEFLEQCRLCDSTHIEEVQKNKQPVIYTCHFGMTEILIPIVDENEVTGVLFLGKFRIEDHPKTQFTCLYEYLKETYPRSFLEEDCEELYAAYKNTTSVSNEKMNAIADLAQISLHGIYLNRWIRNQEFSTQQRFQRYLEDYDFIHMPLSEVSAKQAADDLKISYSQLNRLSTAVTGLPFKQYVLRLKIDAAAEILVKNPSKKVNDIAATLGFDDAHYFSRIFRRKIGECGREYKKTNTK